jgi:hypothetical protein
MACVRTTPKMKAPMNMKRKLDDISITLFRNTNDGSDRSVT